MKWCEYGPRSVVPITLAAATATETLTPIVALTSRSAPIATPTPPTAAAVEATSTTIAVARATITVAVLSLVPVVAEQKKEQSFMRLYCPRKQRLQLPSSSLAFLPTKRRRRKCIFTFI